MCLGTDVRVREKWLSSYIVIRREMLGLVEIVFNVSSWGKEYCETC